MNYKTAHQIMQTTILYEFPFLYLFSLQWALVKSYSIANGTRLLVATGRLTNGALVSKRSEDTGIFLYNLLVPGIDTERGRRVLAKMNWIHAQYGSKITNGDLIHTLALFVLEPIRWIERYEWRPMSELEQVALFVYWKELGNRMGMEDLPETLDHLKIWARAYEQANMAYSENNRKCYDATIGLFLQDVPAWARMPVSYISDALLEDYVRPHLGVAAPPAWAPMMIRGFFACRAFLMRHFFLPRWHSANPGDCDSSTGRIQRKAWLFAPWYVRETWWTKLQRRTGLASDRTPGPQYLSDGYLPEEIGPQEMIERSREPVLKQAAELKAYADAGGAAGNGCPFAFAR